MKLFPLILSFCAVLTVGSAAERPDIILILLDDLGFSDLGYQGSEIETPHIDQLARGGVRFSQFYNSGRCCPTRTSLMTGLHPHQGGIGWMTVDPKNATELARVSELPAYQGFLTQRCVTLAEALSSVGYRTLMTGKWHLGFHSPELLPLQRGFDEFYGCLPGALRFFLPEAPRNLTLGNDPIASPVSTTDEAFYTTDAFTDYGIQFLREAHRTPDQPTFLYLAYNAPHWPLQAFEDDIAKYRGRYRAGWETLRQERFRRQLESGLLPPGTTLTPPTAGLPTWESLTPAQQDEMDLKMAIYAAMIDRVDQNIGKLVAYLREAGRFDDTLILFLSDNGGCQEGGLLGRGEFLDKDQRNLEHDNSYGEAWANASNTPFRHYKHHLHEGGSATPFFMHWPAGIPASENWYGDPGQITDVMPTLLDVAGAEYPAEKDGQPLPSLDGLSLRPAFTGAILNRKHPIVFEHESNASLRRDNWKLVALDLAGPSASDPSRWELYDMSTDRTEQNDVRAAHPEIAATLASEWEAWAARVGVYPHGGKYPFLRKMTKP